MLYIVGMCFHKLKGCSNQVTTKQYLILHTAMQYVVLVVVVLHDIGKIWGSTAYYCGPPGGFSNTHRKFSMTIRNNCITNLVTNLVTTK